MNYYVYALVNRVRGKIYIGYTVNLESRIARHNGLLPSKKTSYTTRNSGKWELVHQETYGSRQEAIKRERSLKSFQGRKFIKGLI